MMVGMITRKTAILCIVVYMVGILIGVGIVIENNPDDKKSDCSDSLNVIKEIKVIEIKEVIKYDTIRVIEGLHEHEMAQPGNYLKENPDALEEIYQ